MSPLSLKHRSSGHLVLGLWCVAVLLVAGVGLIEWDRHRSDLRDQVQAETRLLESTLARLSADAGSALQGIDAFLALADEWGARGAGDSGELDQRLADALRWQPLLRNITLRDGGGGLLASASRQRWQQAPPSGLPARGYRLQRTPDGRLWWVQASVAIRPGATWVGEIASEALNQLLGRQRDESGPWVALHDPSGDLLAVVPPLGEAMQRPQAPPEPFVDQGAPRLVSDPRFHPAPLLRVQRSVADGLMGVSVSSRAANPATLHAADHTGEWVRFLAFGIAILLVAGVLHVLMQRLARAAQHISEQSSATHAAQLARAAAEAAQVQSRDRLAQFLERTPEGFWQVDVRHETVDTNAALSEMLGFPRSELMGRPMAEFVTPESRKVLMDCMSQVATVGKPDNCEVSVIRKDGKRIDCIVHRIALFNEAGGAQGCMTIWTNVTHIKAAQRAVAHYQSTLEQAINAMSDGLAVFGADECLQLWNERYLELYPFMRGRLCVGMTQDDISDIVARHLYPDASPLEIEAHKARRREQRRLGSGSNVFSMPHGIDVEVLDRRVPDGRRVTVFRDVTESRHAARQLAEAHATLEQALDAMTDAFTVFDRDEKLLLWNHRYVEMFPMLAGHIRQGMSQDEISTLTTRALNPDATEAEVTARKQRRREQLQSASGTMAWQTESGHHFELTDRRLPDGKRVTVIRDVTAERETERRLAQARDAAEAGGRAKSRFLASMSHEIRTPLNAVLGMNGLLRDTPLNDEQRKFVDLIAKSGESLLAIINDILDLSRLEAGKMSLEVVSFSLDAAVTDVVSMLTTRAQVKGIALKLQVDPSLRPLQLQGDPSRLRQVLFNLVGNAIKFTDKGHVAVMVEPRGTSGLPARAGTQAFTISVRDTGVGIPSEALPRLFEHFSQADSSTSRRFGGTGLGLAISKEIVELMGGRIDVQSDDGVGSCFSIELSLPLADATDGPAAGAPDTQLSALAPEPGQACLSILVAEDNSFNQLLIRTMLTKMGHHVDIVGDGAEALRQVQALAYDLVLMDMQMPGMDGLDATRAIRAIGGPVGGVPIIALTANVMAEDRAACKAAGMDDFLAKPINADALRAAIEKAVEGRWVA